MKRVTASHQAERIGVHAVAKKVHEDLGWIFRDQNEDFGIDALIEVVVNHRPSGKIVAAQIKSGDSYFSEEVSDGFIFRGESEHLDYWLNHDLPLIVVLFKPPTDTAYWQSVCLEHVSLTPKGWKMVIPRSQKLEAAQAENLEKLASKQERLRAALAEYTCPHCGAGLLERAGSEDHDYVAYACGYLIQDVCQRPCPFDPQFPGLEEYRLEFHECGSAVRKTWLCLAVPVTAAAENLKLKPGYASTKEEAEKGVRAEYDHCSSKGKTLH